MIKKKLQRENILAHPLGSGILWYLPGLPVWWITSTIFQVIDTHFKDSSEILRKFTKPFNRQRPIYIWNTIYISTNTILNTGSVLIVPPSLPEGKNTFRSRRTLELMFLPDITPSTDLTCQTHAMSMPIHIYYKFYVIKITEVVHYKKKVNSCTSSVKEETLRIY